MASAKQIAWRKKFAKLVKAGAYRKGSAKKKRNVAHPSSKRLVSYAKKVKARATTKPAAKRSSTKKKNPVSCIRNGKRIYGAAAQAVLKSRGKKMNGSKKRATKRPVAKRRNSLTPFPGAVPVRKYFRSGTARLSAWKDAEKRGQQRLFSMNGRRRKRNSAASTAEAFEQFQGRAPSATIDVMIPDTAPKDVYVLGMLTEIKTDRDEISFDPGDAYLVADKNDNLYVGATKATNSAFESNEFLGEIKELSYVTVKDHLDGEEMEYVHKLGEEGGEKPALITNEKCQLEIIGGDYFITADGIRD